MTAYQRALSIATARAAMRGIFRSTAAQHGITEADLYVRDKSTAPIRWAAWAACRDAGFTYAAIAKLAGWNHTSVVHGVDRHLNGAVRL